MSGWPVNGSPDGVKADWACHRGKNGTMVTCGADRRTSCSQCDGVPSSWSISADQSSLSRRIDHSDWVTASLFIGPSSRSWQAQRQKRARTASSGVHQLGGGHRDFHRPGSPAAPAGPRASWHEPGPASRMLFPSALAPEINAFVRLLPRSQNPKCRTLRLSGVEL